MTSNDSEPKSTPDSPTDYPGGPLNDYMGIEILEASTERVVARMPVAGNTQPYGLLHGTHHRSARDGHVTAVATPLSLGNTLATWDIAITDDQDRRICTSRLTCLLRDAPPSGS